MNAAKLRELYASEARDNIASLGRALLELESSDARAATDAAFRAAHNLKALAASIGDAQSARLAHALEDRLATLRESPDVVPDVDVLLAEADALEASIERGLAAPPDLPAARTLRIRLRPDAPLKAARAALIRQAVERLGALRDMHPEHPDDSFRGEIELLVDADADAESVIAAVRRAGDIDYVGWDEPESARRTDPEPEPAQRRDAEPAAPVRIDAALFDAISDAVAELVVLRSRLPADANELVADRIGQVVGALQDAVLEARMVPVREAFDRFPRLVREAARATGKQVELRVEGEDVRLDRAILEALVEPLSHLLRNAVDHGIEAPAEREAAAKPSAGVLTLRAARSRNSLRIEVSDDGRGIDRRAVAARGAALPGAGAGAPGTDAAAAEPDDDALLRILSQPGFSLAGRVTELSGRGVGLDVVVERVRALGGVLAMRTESGRGTRFVLRMPLTLAVTQALRVRVGGDQFAIPLTHIAEVVELDGVLIVASAGREAVRLRGQLVPLIRLRDVLGMDGSGDERAAVLAEIGARRAALAVDALLAREQIVVRPFDAPAGAASWFAGASLLDDGRPILILDPASVS